MNKLALKFTVFLILLIAIPIFGIASPVCEKLFLDKNIEGEVVSKEFKEQYAAALKDPVAYAESLNLSAKSLKLKGYLGFGVDAMVVLVQSGKKTYALRILDTPQELIPSSYSHMIIQKFLGDLGLAPKVVGILNPSESRKWFNANEKSIRKYVNKLELEREDGFHFNIGSSLGAAMVMEVVKSDMPRAGTEIGLKVFASTKPLALEKKLHESIVNQAQKIDKVLSELNIAAWDTDAAITSSNKLMLIDTGMYYSNPTTKGRSTHMIENFINKTTEPR